MRLRTPLLRESYVHSGIPVPSASRATMTNKSPPVLTPPQCRRAWRTVHFFQNPLLVSRAELAPLRFARYFQIRKTGYKSNRNLHFAHDDSLGRTAL